MSSAFFGCDKEQPKQANQAIAPAPRKEPAAPLAGKVKIRGDIVSPIVEEANWECLK